MVGDKGIKRHGLDWRNICSVMLELIEEEPREASCYACHHTTEFYTCHRQVW